MQTIDENADLARQLEVSYPTANTGKLLCSLRGGRCVHRTSTTRRPPVLLVQRPKLGLKRQHSWRRYIARQQIRARGHPIRWRSTAYVPTAALCWRALS